MAMHIEWGVEYYPNEHEGEQFDELSEQDFKELILAHTARGIEPSLRMEWFSLFDNGREGKRLTLVDTWGIYYG
jgi:hypothetical protein